MKMSEYDNFIATNPHLERYFDEVPAFTYNGRAFGSLDAGTDNTWKEVLAKISEKMPASPLADKYGKKKSIKEVKTRETIKKHVKKARDKALSRR